MRWRCAHVQEVAIAAGLLLLAGCGDDAPTHQVGGPTLGFSDATDQALVWADFGGLHNEASVQVFLEPWAAASGGSFASDIVDDSRLLGGGRVPWDIANANRFVIDLGCKQHGWATPLDTSVVRVAGYPHEYVGRCWIAPWLYGGVLAYNPDLVSRPPRTWADFFNLKEFPGARGALDFSGFAQQFEIGTLANGVPVSQVYPTLRGTTEQQGRAAMQAALRPWQSIRRKLIFQSYGAEQLAQLDQGEVVMAMVSTPRALAAIRDGANIAVAWETSIVGLSTFMVPRDSAHARIAMEVLNWMLDPEKQVEFARTAYYGPTSPQAQQIIARDPALCAVILSCARRLTDQTLTIDDNWYGSRAEMIVDIWSNWKRGQ